LQEQFYGEGGENGVRRKCTVVKGEERRTPHGRWKGGQGEAADRRRINLDLSSTLKKAKSEGRSHPLNSG